ncbi:MAG: outer membrane lipoprotein carrier protein LolA [Proteobacteria bacterium]|nr:outer membrane lipoprotein carrier protein LolA [Pseudomonadota bacterium]
MKNIPALLVLALCALTLPLHAEAPAPQPTIKPLTAEKTDSDEDAQKKAAALSAEDRETISRIETYFNTIHTLRAEFMQTLSDGNTSTGTLSIRRPGKMRLEYTPPNHDLLVADGLFVHAWDSQAKTSSSVPLGRSMADIILRDPLKLSGDVDVKEIRYFPEMIEVDIVQSDDPASGILTLEFQDKPLQLKNWRVKDGQGTQTRVALYNEQVNQDIPSSTFVYRDPNFGH